MQPQDQSVSRVAIQVEEHPAGHAKVTLEGRLDSETAGPWWRDLEKRLQARPITSLEVDASRLDLQGGIGIALLRFIQDGAMTPRASVTISGLSPTRQKIMEVFTREDFRTHQARRPERLSFATEVGVVTRAMLKDVGEQVTFIGAVVRAVPGVIIRPKRLRWQEVKRVLESAGANALPMVALFSWLVGLVLALEAAHPLAKLGAQIFIADMIGFASIRDTGPLVTAIMLAGRSGSAFAAELGTMKVNEELDALKTMGLEPVRFLVIQRVLAAMLLSPLLALYAMAMGILGGVMVMRFLGFPPRMIFHQILGRVQVGDLSVGLLKSLLFGLIIGGVGCLRGLQTKQGARAVGDSTTRSVVACIILIILANTLFSAVDYFLTRPS